MIDNYFRERFPAYATPVLELLASSRFSPLWLTGAGFLFAILSAIAIIFNQPLVALVLWWIGRLFDGLDGLYARMTGAVSSFGAYCDIVSDMAAYSLFVMAMSVVHPEFTAYWLVILCGYILCSVSAITLGSLELAHGVPARDNRSLRLAAGVAEGGETGIMYSLFLIFPDYLYLLLPLWICILLGTVALRTVLAHRILQ